jgi:hypothetical protein
MKTNLSIEILIALLFIGASVRFIYCGGFIPITCGIIGILGTIFYLYKTIKDLKNEH